MMKLRYIFILFFISVSLISCGNESNRRDYVARDGLFYKYNSSELYTGVVVDTSDIIISFEVVKGVKHGAFITFYMNGNYEKYGHIKDNKNEGEWRYFYPNGQVESVGNFENNVPNGRWIIYYPDGNVKADGTYINGEQQGAWLYYDTNGELINILFFDNGFLLDIQRKI